MDSDDRSIRRRSAEDERPLNSAQPQALTVADFERGLPRLKSITTDFGNSHSSCFYLTKRILDSNKTTVFMTLVTIYALFADDLRLAVTEKSSDDYFFAGAATCMGLFLIEISLAFWVKPTYRFSFNFYLDVISTISLIPDIGWLWALMSGTSDTGTSSQVNQVRNAGKLSRTGARTSRIVRIVRLIRIIRLVKLYKSAQTAYTKNQSEASKVSPEEEYTIPEESKIGRKLGDLTTKRVIVLVLLLLIVLPLFDLTFYISSFTSWECGAKEMDRFFGTNAFDITKDVYIDFHKDDVRPLLFLSVTTSGMSVVWDNGPNPNDLRLEEKYYILEGSHVAIFDIRYDTQLDALLNIFRTIFVCIVLSLGAVYLTKDANTLVIVPIEKMIDKVKKIAKNPLGILEDNMQDVYDLEKPKEIKQKWWQRICCIKMSQPKELETMALESAILKIGALLAISFGEAGARVIGENISKGDTINPMLEGKKVIAIFGFCDIRRFTDTTEVLQETVMTFVNEIAHIVHHTVDHHLGMANKNIGDAFMIVWKFRDELYIRTGENLSLDTSSHIVHNTSDLAIISFLKILSKINRNSIVVKYREHPDLKRRIPGYSVMMGFSLHCGWAIEGAIGSALKIDASYLSPHVNIVMKLEELTKLYSVPILISGAVISLTSGYVKKHCRHLDTVQSSSGISVRIYTYDVDLSSATPINAQHASKAKTKGKHRELLQRMENPLFNAYTQFETSKHLVNMQKEIGVEYIQLYNEGMEAFEDGKWDKTKSAIEECLGMKPIDVPSKVMLTFLSSHSFLAPPDWSGSRAFPH